MERRDGKLSTLVSADIVVISIFTNDKLAIQKDRQTLASSGLVPQTYDFEELEVMGM